MDGVRETWTLVCEENNCGSGAFIVNSSYQSEAVNKKEKKDIHHSI
jgi:hypothetical protein